MKFFEYRTLKHNKFIQEKMKTRMSNNICRDNIDQILSKSAPTQQSDSQTKQLLNGIMAIYND
jgi:hypothetical protein